MVPAGDDLRHCRETVIDIGKPLSFTGGLEFSSLTYAVTKKMNLDGGKSSGAS